MFILSQFCTPSSALPLSLSFTLCLYYLHNIEQKTLCIVSLTRSTYLQSKNVCTIKTNISCFKTPLFSSFRSLISTTFLTRLRFSFVLFCWSDTRSESKVQIDLMHLNYDMKHELSLLFPWVLLLLRLMMKVTSFNAETNWWKFAHGIACGVLCACVFRWQFYFHTDNIPTAIFYLSAKSTDAMRCVEMGLNECQW